MRVITPVARDDETMEPTSVVYRRDRCMTVRSITPSSRSLRRITRGRCDAISADIIDTAERSRALSRPPTSLKDAAQSFVEDEWDDLVRDEYRLRHHIEGRQPSEIRRRTETETIAACNEHIGAMFDDLDKLHGEARDAEARRRDLNRAGRRAVERGKAVHQDQSGHHDRRRRTTRCAGPPGADRPAASPTAAHAPPSTVRVDVGCNMSRLHTAV